MNKYFKSQKNEIAEYKPKRTKLSRIEIWVISLTLLIVVVISGSLLSDGMKTYFREGRGRRGYPNCTSNERQIAAGIAMYTQDHEDFLPKSYSVWTDTKSDPGVLTCPKVKRLKNGHLYNNNLSGINLNKIKNPDKRILTIDGKTNIEAKRTIENICYSPLDIQYRYGDRKIGFVAIASYLDGHVEGVNSYTEPESWDK